MHFDYLIKDFIPFNSSTNMGRSCCIITDNELLLAISNLLDSKFSVQDKKFKAIDEKFDAIDDKFKAIDEKFDAIEDKFKAIDEKFDAIDKRFDAIDKRFDAIEDKLSVLDEMNSRLKRLETQQEENILPRLQNIESCYLSTYQRYSNSVNQIETMQTDIDILKKVVTEHSKIIQKIS